MLSHGYVPSLASRGFLINLPIVYSISRFEPRSFPKLRGFSLEKAASQWRVLSGHPRFSGVIW